MPLLTVRLTDEEHAALKGLAAGRSMTDLVKHWIAAGTPVYTAEDAGKTPSVDTVDMSTATPSPYGSSTVRPTFIAAPDDDCVVCGHDRQSYHLTGPCRAPAGGRRTCGCDEFVDAAEPL